MPALPLSIGLPPGVDPSEALWKQVRQAGAGSGFKWTVAGGELWLVQAIQVFWNQLSGPYARLVVTATLEDQDGNDVASVTTGTTNSQNGNNGAAFILGGSAPAFEQPGNSNLPNGSLPWMLTPAGYSWTVFFRPFGGADSTGLQIGTMSVTYWETTGAGSGPPAIETGPFMLVPGPEAA